MNKINLLLLLWLITNVFATFHLFLDALTEITTYSCVYYYEFTPYDAIWILSCMWNMMLIVLYNVFDWSREK